MKNKVVYLPTTKSVVHDSPGFAKKLLADAHVELGALCGASCSYCSSNHGNFLRINREAFANETERQLGERIAPVDFTTSDGRAFKADPALTFTWPDVAERLAAELAKKPKGWGADKLLILSQLTDPFSPEWVANGTTEAVLRLLLGGWAGRLRILTKFAGVAKPPFLPLLVEHRENVLVGLSIGTLDDNWAKAVEIGTSPPSARVRAHRALQDAGVPTYGMMCPVFPDVLDDKPGKRLEDLLDALRPNLCKHVYFEAVNDRQNWQAIASGYPEGHPARAWFARVWRDGDTAAWSRYATDLHVRVMARARREGWEARHLLYEDMITKDDAVRGFARWASDAYNLRGVLLQSPTTRKGFREGEKVGGACIRADDGWSRNPYMRALQTAPEHGHADGWPQYGGAS